LLSSEVDISFAITKDLYSIEENFNEISRIVPSVNTHIFLLRQGLSKPVLSKMSNERVFDGASDNLLDFNMIIRTALPPLVVFHSNREGKDSSFLNHDNLMLMSSLMVCNILDVPSVLVLDGTEGEPANQNLLLTQFAHFSLLSDQRKLIDEVIRACIR